MIVGSILDWSMGDHTPQTLPKVAIDGAGTWSRAWVGDLETDNIDRLLTDFGVTSDRTKVGGEICNGKQQREMRRISHNRLESNSTPFL